MAVSIADAKNYEEQMNKPDLIFVTPENKDRLMAMPELREYWLKQKQIEKEEADANYDKILDGLMDGAGCMPSTGGHPTTDTDTST